MNKKENVGLPKKIKLGPLNIPIEMFDGISDTTVLDGIYINGEIKLRVNQNLEDEKVTLLHEILHAILINVGLDNDETHKLIYIISFYLADVLIRNPDLLKYIEKKSE